MAPPMNILTIKSMARKNSNPFLNSPNQINQQDSSKTPNLVTPLTDTTMPLLVVGSANANIYVEIDRLRNKRGIISAKSEQTLPGDKGVNQGAYGGKLSYPTCFLGQVGEDAHRKLIVEALESGGVHLDRMSVVSGATIRHANVMLQSGVMTQFCDYLDHKKDDENEKEKVVLVWKCNKLGFSSILVS
ncbi:hypothetical protein FF1_031061 [Malus domestica]